MGEWFGTSRPMLTNDILRLPANWCCPMDTVAASCVKRNLLTERPPGRGGRQSVRRVDYADVESDPVE
jgi:hypothetical protein